MSDQHIACFMYGTLRVGQGNHQWAKDGTDERLNITGATTKGDLYFVSGHGGFPVAKLDGAGIIVGDIVFFDPDSECYQSVRQMERGAGYEERLVETILSDGSTLMAWAWHYLREPRGELIPDGDWVAARTVDAGSW